MKVIDPQSALLTTAEVHQFLQDNKPRKPDKKVGAYNSVNVLNHNLVRRDLETYIQTCTPYVTRQTSSEEWMKGLVKELRRYELTKTEVFALINLGVGLNEPSPTTSDEIEAHEDQDAVDVKREDGADDVADRAGEDENEESMESGLDRMLFGLVVEEADERFAGDEGEERITQILQILKNASTDVDSAGTNGVHEK